jgi:hypothetical protein
MNFKQLYDPKASVVYTVDGQALIFKISGDGSNKQTRLKPHHAAILAALFTRHPNPVPYSVIQSILKSSRLACPDETRLHRKVSELRNELAGIHPTLSDLILNIRGIGYSLPLHLKDPESGSTTFPKFKNKRLQQSIDVLKKLVAESLRLSRKCSVVKSDDHFRLQRKLVHAELELMIEGFEVQKKSIFNELKLHPQDFVSIRLEFVFAKLKTYVGLARISEFSITKEQWWDWHEVESQEVLQDLVQWTQLAERGDN